MDAVTTPLRLVEPVGLFFRAGRNDHTALARLIASDAPAFTGVVLDASHAARHGDLLVDLAHRRFTSVLDPMALELATPGGWERPGLRALPWAGANLHSPAALSTGDALGALVDPIARFAIENRYTAVIAPSHLISGVEDPWWRIDQAACHRLREQLDASGGRDIVVYYRLAIARRTLVDAVQRRSIIARLKEQEVDALWLCLHPVSASAGASVLISYIELCRNLVSLRIPLVAERTGFLGLTLLGFNAVAAIESGITIGERFDVGRLVRPPRQRDNDESRPFAMSPRVYIERLGIYMKRKDATNFFTTKGMRRRFGCQDKPCCRTPEDSIRDPRRHFMYARAAQVAQIERVPAHNRAKVHLDTIRMASDDAAHAARVDKRFQSDQKRLGGWREALKELVKGTDCTAPPVTLAGGRLRRRKSA